MVSEYFLIFTPKKWRHEMFQMDWFNHQRLKKHLGTSLAVNSTNTLQLWCFFFGGADFLNHLPMATLFLLSFVLFFFGGALLVIYLSKVSKEWMLFNTMHHANGQYYLYVSPSDCPCKLTHQFRYNSHQFPLQSSHINSNLISPNKKSEVPLQKFPLQNLSPILRPKDCGWSM